MVIPGRERQLAEPESITALRSMDSGLAASRRSGMTARRRAAANNLVILYPQATRSSANPSGCWDFWGYSGADYHGQKGKQMRAVMAMVARLLGAQN